MMMWLIVFSCTETSQDTGWRNCDQAPLVNYDNFGQRFLIHNCQACHASTTNNRYGAPEDVFFDTKEATSLWLDRIHATTIGEGGSMPPAGTIAEDDHIQLYWWLVCEEGIEE